MNFTWCVLLPLKDMVHANYKKKDIAGMTASEQLAAINEKQGRW